MHERFFIYFIINDHYFVVKLYSTNHCTLESKWKIKCCSYIRVFSVHLFIVFFLFLKQLYKKYYSSQSIWLIQSPMQTGRRGEPIGQRGNRVNVLLADKQQLLGSISVGNMALSQDQHRLLATANIHPYQSVVGQLVQSPRVLQQVALQVYYNNHIFICLYLIKISILKHPQSVVSVDSVMHAQSPLPGTPSPGSSSASTGSGSGSGLAH